MIAFLIFYLLLFLVSIGGICFSSKNKPKNRSFFLHLLITLIATYFVSLIETFIHPYWEDNGVEQRIIFPDHFSWALLEASLLQLVGVPFFFGLIKLFSMIQSKILKTKN